jgi:hypothetical protein
MKLRPRTFCVAQAGLELAIPLPQLPECWDYRSALPQPSSLLCMLSTVPYHWAAPQPLKLSFAETRPWLAAAPVAAAGLCLTSAVLLACLSLLHSKRCCLSGVSDMFPFTWVNREWVDYNEKLILWTLHQCDLRYDKNHGREMPRTTAGKCWRVEKTWALEAAKPEGKSWLLHSLNKVQLNPCIVDPDREYGKRLPGYKRTATQACRSECGLFGGSFQELGL